MLTTRVVCLPQNVYESTPAVDVSFGMDNPYALYALWDTGADRSCIKSTAAVRLGMHSSFAGRVDVEGVNSPEQSRRVYKGVLVLPNNICFVEQKLVDVDFWHGKADILIGMDIISQGDFAILNGGGSTTFTFARPPKPRAVHNA